MLESSYSTSRLIMFKKKVSFSMEIQKKEFFEINDNRNEKFLKYIDMCYKEILSKMLINKQKNLKLLLALAPALNNNNNNNN